MLRPSCVMFLIVSILFTNDKTIANPIQDTTIMITEMPTMNMTVNLTTESFSIETTADLTMNTTTIAQIDITNSTINETTNATINETTNATISETTNRTISETNTTIEETTISASEETTGTTIITTTKKSSTSVHKKVTLQMCGPRLVRILDAVCEKASQSLTTRQNAVESPTAFEKRHSIIEDDPFSQTLRFKDHAQFKNTLIGDCCLRACSIRTLVKYC